MHTKSSARSMVLSWMLLLGPLSVNATFRVCDDVQEPVSLDPYQVFAEKPLTVIQQMMEGLLRLSPEGKPQAALAERWERIDPLKVRFFLRKNVVFHDGEPFNAAAVKFSLERYVDPNTRYPGFGFVNSIARVEIVDDYTVDIVTNYPDGLLFNRLAAFLHVVPPNYYKKVGPEAFSAKPIGTGPFQFKEWIKGKKIGFIKNANYWNPGYPKMDSLEFVFLAAEQQFDALKAGRIDFMTDLPGTYTTWTMENPTTIVKKVDSYSIVIGHFNTSPGGILADRRVRLAINYAINRDEFIQYDLLGNGHKLASIALPGMQGYDPSISPYPFDLAKAKQLLKEAGVKEGTTLKAIAIPQATRAANILKSQLQSVGINVSVTIIANTEVVQAFQKERYDIGITNLPNPLAHMYFPLSIFFFSQSPFSLMQDPEFDGKLMQAVATTDPQLQDVKFKELNRYVYDQAVAIPIYQRIKTFGVSRRVFFTPYVTGMPYFIDAMSGVKNTSKTAQ